MHEIGEITCAIQDAILQKPGKLTAEEYEIMKTHAERGGGIIQETFGHMGDAAYEKVAYEVADVFDAVSAKITQICEKNRL